MINVFQHALNTKQQITKSKKQKTLSIVQDAFLAVVATIVVRKLDLNVGCANNTGMRSSMAAADNATPKSFAKLLHIYNANNINIYYSNTIVIITRRVLCKNEFQLYLRLQTIDEQLQPTHRQPLHVYEQLQQTNKHYINSFQFRIAFIVTCSNCRQFQNLCGFTANRWFQSQTKHQ
jgi:hypothetical protein